MYNILYYIYNIIWYIYNLLIYVYLKKFNRVYRIMISYFVWYLIFLFVVVIILCILDFLFVEEILS